MSFTSDTNNTTIKLKRSNTAPSSLNVKPAEGEAVYIQNGGNNYLVIGDGDTQINALPQFRPESELNLIYFSGSQLKDKNNTSINPITVSSNVGIVFGNDSTNLNTLLNSNTVVYTDGSETKYGLKAKTTEDTSSDKRYVLTSTNAATNELKYNTDIYTQSGVLYGAGWNPATVNDYAESRLVQTEAEAGQCVVEVGNGIMVISSEYLQPTGSIVSDTYGHRIGPKTADYKAIAISGRVLVYVDQSKGKLEVGDCVMTAPNGKVAKMTRRQIKKYPDRIVGIVSEFPEYNTWGKIEVKDRVWIRVK